LTGTETLQSRVGISPELVHSGAKGVGGFVPIREFTIGLELIFVSDDAPKDGPGVRASQQVFLGRLQWRGFNAFWALRGNL
jgi:hypothetical protein